MSLGRTLLRVRVPPEPDANRGPPPSVALLDLDAPRVVALGTLAKDLPGQVEARFGMYGPRVAMLGSLRRHFRSMGEDLRQNVHSAIGGDQHALDSLFGRNLPKLMAYIRVRMGAGLVARESVSVTSRSTKLGAVTRMGRPFHRVRVHTSSSLIHRSVPPIAALSAITCS